MSWATIKEREGGYLLLLSIAEIELALTMLPTRITRK